MFQFRKYCHPVEWLELSVQKTIFIRSKGSPELSVPKQSPTFKPCSSQSVEKTQDVIRAKKRNHQPFELVQPFQKTLSYLAEVQQTLTLSLSHVSLAFSYLRKWMLLQQSYFFTKNLKMLNWQFSVSSKTGKFKFWKTHQWKCECMVALCSSTNQIKDIESFMPELLSCKTYLRNEARTVV